MKKLLSILLIIAMLFSFAACGMDAETQDLVLDLVGEVVESALGESEGAPPTEDLGDVAEEPSSAPADETTEEPREEPSEEPSEEPAIDEFGTYTTAEDVALYIYTYGKLPENFITKDEARALGWPGGGLEDYAPGCCIGGDYFGNREGLLPKDDYRECDIDTLGADSRGAKRLVFSDTAIYYTEDHYETFVQLY